MPKNPEVLIREYPDANRMNRDAQKLAKRGWHIADTQIVTNTTQNSGCGCLFGLFGSMRSKHKNKYLVRYEQRAV